MISRKFSEIFHIVKLSWRSRTRKPFTLKTCKNTEAKKKDAAKHVLTKMFADSRYSLGRAITDPLDTAQNFSIIPTDSFQSMPNMPVFAAK